MALLNYLASGTYCVVDRIRYDSGIQRCSWVLCIYRDPDRRFFLANKEFEALKDGHVVYLTDLEIRNTPPSQPQEGDTYCIGSTPTNEWLGASDGYATFSNGEWLLWGAAPWQIYKYNGKFYQRADSVFQETDCLADSELWETFLGKTAIYANDTNLTKQIYKIMMTLPSMAGVISDE